MGTSDLHLYPKDHLTGAHLTEVHLMEAHHRLVDLLVHRHKDQVVRRLEEVHGIRHLPRSSIRLLMLPAVRMRLLRILIHIRIRIRLRTATHRQDQRRLSSQWVRPEIFITLIVCSY